MSSGYCRECDERHEITVTDRPVGRTGSAMRWRLVLHARVTVDETGQPSKVICDGSGSLI